MTFEFEGRTVILLEHNPGEPTSRMIGTEINLGVSANLDKTKYLDNNGLPTENGSKILTDVFVQGLLANIHNAHQRKLRDSAEHVRYIISELERGFVAITKAGEGEFTDTDLPANPVISINFNTLSLKTPKYNTGEALYKICEVDPEKQKLYIEYGSDDILIVNDGTKVELWTGATLYPVNKIITSG